MPLEDIHLESEHRTLNHVGQSDAIRRLRDISLVDKYLWDLSPRDKIGREGNEKLKTQILWFLEKAANNTLEKSMMRYSSKAFDTNTEVWLDKFEFERFSKALGEAVKMIIMLNSFEKFESIQSDIHDNSWLSNLDKRVAAEVDLTKTLIGKNETGKNKKDALDIYLSKSDLARSMVFEKPEIKQLQEFMKNIGWFSSEFLKEISEKPFSFSPRGGAELTILLAKEVGESAIDLVKLMANVPSGIILLPRYLSYRIDANSSNIEKQAEGTMKLEALVRENPSLWVVDLLWEKGIEALSGIATTMKSGKQWDIAKSLTIIAWLLAGWSGIAKLSITNARKVMVIEARRIGIEWRKWTINGSAERGRELRNNLRSFGKVASTMARKTAEVDSILSGSIFAHSLSWQNFTHADESKKVQNLEKLQKWEVPPLWNPLYTQELKGYTLGKQEVRTGYCGGYNMQALSKEFGMNIWELERVGFKKTLSPKDFVTLFNKYAPEWTNMKLIHPPKEALLSTIEDLMSKKIPIPIIYTPIGGKINAPHYATIVGVGTLSDWSKVYKIADSMSDAIPRDFLTASELIDAMKFRNLGVNASSHIGQAVGPFIQAWIGWQYSIFHIERNDASKVRRIRPTRSPANESPFAMAA